MKLSSECDCCCEDNLIHDAMFTKQEQGDDDFAKDFAKAEECPNGFVLQTGKPEEDVCQHGSKLYWQIHAAWDFFWSKLIINDVLIAPVLKLKVDNKRTKQLNCEIIHEVDGLRVQSKS